MTNQNQALTVPISTICKECNISKVQLMYAIRRGRIPQPTKKGIFPTSPLFFTDNEAEAVRKAFLLPNTP